MIRLHNVAHDVTVSVVSHGQGALVANLLDDLSRCPEVVSIILIHNIPEQPPQCPDVIMDRVHLVKNERPIGFAANHNAAFQLCSTPYFCVLNPDLRLRDNPFPELLAYLSRMNSALVAPAVLNPDGEVEDSARVFPSLGGLFSKAMRGADGRISYQLGDSPFRPDWVAGMFMLFGSEWFRAVGGFDAKYYLYYEDVDICARLRNEGGAVVLCPAAVVMHDAHRMSRRKVRYMMWHLSSMARYFYKHRFFVRKRVAL